jgi:acyl-CoA synthetase (AMP-forming)/AMP-acid ligase II
VTLIPGRFLPLTEFVSRNAEWYTDKTAIICEGQRLSFSMMTEYYNNPDKTREIVWHDKQGREYIRTGDIGKLDEDGYLYILDRKKDLIISGGINIFPSDIEEVLIRHPEIAEAAVIGVPHREWGESPLALVVKKRPDSQLGEDELRDWANRYLADYQRLAAVEFRQSLPRNDLGKVLKSELRQSYLENLENRPNPVNAIVKFKATSVEICPAQE